MKKLKAIFFLIIYAGAAQGIAVDFHYCNGKLTDVALANFGSHKGCGCNDSKIPMNCCQNRVFYNNADNHNTNQPDAVIKPLCAQLDLQLCYLTNEIVKRNCSTRLKDCVPFQRSCLQPIYLLLQNFRI